MHKLTKILGLAFLFLLAFQLNTAEAQYGKKKKRKKKPEPKEQVDKGPKNFNTTSDKWLFKDRLWYGAGANLGFRGGNGISIFNIGLSPMVGYKIIESLSIGPRIGFNYTYLKALGSDRRIKKVQPTSFEYGVFSRFKFLPMLFAHTEFSFANEQVVFEDGGGYLALDPTGEVITERVNTQNLYLGLGYISGDVIGYEIMLLYNALQDNSNTFDLPFSFRAGFNYKF